MKSTLQTIGIVLGITGIVMFFLGIYGFSEGFVNPILNEIGKFSFIYWSVTFIVGVILLLISRKMSK